MNDYAAYVWAAYGISGGALLAMAVLAIRAWLKAKRRIKELPTKF